MTGVTWAVYEHERQAPRREPLVHRVQHTRPAPCEQWPLAEEYLRKRGLSADIARWNGWYTSEEAGDTAVRLVIPATGTLVAGYWQARALFSVVTPRYQSPHGPRGDALVLVWPADADTAVTLRTAAHGTVICEGPLDALAAAGEGYVGIGLMGNQPPPEATEYLIRLCQRLPSPTILMADNDQPWVLIKVLEELWRCRVHARFATPAPWKDLAEVSLTQREAVLARA